MVISFDAASSATGSGVTSLTWSHVISGTQRILVVACQVDSAGISGITFAGVAMTRITNQSTPSGNFDYYYQFTPPTGSHSIVVTLNASASPRAVAASYNGVKGSSPDTSNSNGGTGTSLAVNLTTTVNNDWLIGAAWVANGDTPGTSGGGTSRTSVAYLGILDSNAAITPAGATSISATAGGSTAIRFSVLAIKPATVSPTTTTSSSTSTSTSTSSSTTSSSSTSTSSTTTGAPPPDVQETGIPIVYISR